jgi:hypothetical protein
MGGVDATGLRDEGELTPGSQAPAGSLGAGTFFTTEE